MSFFNQEKASELIPEHMHGGLKRYLDDKISPGSFLMAVLTNNLKEAVGRADHINLRALPEYITYLYNYAPRTCWGSPEKVAAWLSEDEELKNDH